MFPTEGTAVPPRFAVFAAAFVGRVAATWFLLLVTSGPVWAALILEPAQDAGKSPNSRFGDYLRSSDVDRDGFADLVVSDWEHAQRRGVIRLHRGGPQGLSETPAWSMEGRHPEEHLGHGLEVLDANLDGWPDLVVSRNACDPLDPASVGFEVFSGGPNGFGSVPARTWCVRLPGLGLPHRLLAAADVNGDGRVDLLCGGGDTTRHAGGWPCVFAFVSSTNGLSSAPQWIVYGEEPFDFFGFSIADAGDVNGDGFHDLIIGAPKFSQVRRENGRAYVFLGGPNGVSTNAAWVMDYPLSIRTGVDSGVEHHFGWAVAGIGDVNGDGFGDIAVGAPYADHDEVDEGVVCVFHGSSQGLSKAPDAVIEGNHAFATLGVSVAAVGDVDGDGLDDLAIGAESVSDDQVQEGAVLIVRGGRDGVQSEAWWTRMSNRSDARLGHRLARGDFDGDGHPDLAATAFNEGKSASVFVWQFGPASPGANPDWHLGKTWFDRARQYWTWSSRTVRAAGIGLGGILLVLPPVFALRWHLRMRRAAVRADLAIANERTRIARDLHDELGTHLSRLRAASDGPGTAESAREITVGIERTIWALHPERHSLPDLACGLTDLAGNILCDTAIRCRFDIPIDLPDEPLPTDILEALYRATQEALTNVRKYSGASEAVVSLELPAGRLRVVIQDNGRGCLVTAAGNGRGSMPQGGLGAANMVARLHGVGGTCEWAPAPASGTRVVLTVPRR